MREGKYRWSDVESGLKNITPVNGGYSNAHRGIILLPDGKQAFFKAGVDDATNKWAQKEIATYRFLAKHSFPYIPELLTFREEETGFVLEVLTAQEGWDWTESWNEERLAHTLNAMDTLAKINDLSSHQSGNNLS
jgi:hypothetical protein